MRRRIALDLDGTIATYGGWLGKEIIGDPIPGAVSFTHHLSTLGDVVIWSTRLNPDPFGTEESPLPVRTLKSMVETYLNKHGFSYSEIFTGPAKPGALCYIDDRAITCNPQLLVDGQRDLMAYSRVLNAVKKLLLSS